MSLYAPLIRAARLRAGLLESQAESIADENPTAAAVLRGLALVEQQVGEALERDQREMAQSIKAGGRGEG